MNPTNDPTMTPKEALMKTLQFMILVTFVALFIGCATVAPNELVNARSAYQIASQGPAEQLVPAELHKAHEALVLAEQSFLKDPDSQKTKDLAYVAQRKSEQAGALGAMAADKASKDKANADFRKKQTEIVKQGKQDLSDSEQRTAAAQAEIDKQAAVKEVKDKSDAEFQKQQAEIVKQGRQDLSDSEQRTAAAVAELAAIAAVKEEERGLVVTLSGGVLFRSAESTLLSSAKVKLDQVANALLAVRARNLIVEGHTDSQGSASYNQGLSQRRADAVRDYLVQRGYPTDRIQARGKGKGSPIADNASPEGRANNRRVEIIIER
jgi:outer membrane protein OmpA-like peptidoglycan-associated protein